MWSNTTFYPGKRLHTDDGEEYVTLELQFFLREQEVIHEISTPYVYLFYQYPTEPFIAAKREVLQS